MDRRTGFSAQMVVYRRQPDGGILVLGLLKRAGKKTWWQSPRGSIEENESPAEAALRETREETGIEKPLAFYDLDLVYKFDYSREIPDTGNRLVTEVTEYSFAAETDREDIVLSDEHVGYKWMTPEEALETFEFESSREPVKRLLALLKEKESEISK